MRQRCHRCALAMTGQQDGDLAFRNRLQCRNESEFGIEQQRETRVGKSRVNLRSWQLGKNGSSGNAGGKF